MKQRSNPMFYITLVSQILVIVQLVLASLGYASALTDAVQHKIMAIVDGFVAILATMGVFIDPTGSAKAELIKDVAAFTVDKIEEKPAVPPVEETKA